MKSTRLLDFLVGDEGALGADQLGRAGRQIKHVALAEQFVGAHGVENGARIHLGGDLKGDARGNVRLDDAGDDIHARPLGGDDAMDAGGARHLGDAGDGHFHIGGRDEHEVGQLINDNDDVAEFFGNDDVLVARHDNFLVHFHGEAVRARLDFFLLADQRQFQFGLRQRLVLGPFVEGFDVAHADVGKNLVALFHFVDDPAQGEDDLFGIGDDRHDEMRQGVVLLQLDDLGINHHETKLVRAKTCRAARR